MEQNYNLSSLVSDFMVYAERNGLRVSKECATQLFSALSASKLLCFPKGKYYSLLSQMISGFFGNEFFADVVDENWKYSSNIFQDISSNETNFAKAMKCAVNNSAMVITAGLVNVDFSFMPYFEEMKKHIRAPKVEFSYTIGSNEVVNKESFWIFAVGNGFDKYSLPVDIGKYATIVVETNNAFVQNVENSFNQNPNLQIPIVLNSSPLTFLDFDEIIREALSSHFIGFEQWKKIDKLENYLNLLCGNKFDNVELRQIERYLASALAIGATEMEAIDFCLAYKILPVVGGYQKSMLNTLNVPLKKFVCDLFGQENLQNTLKTIEKLGL